MTNVPGAKRPPVPLEAFSYDGRIFASRAELETYITDENIRFARETIISISRDIAAHAAGPQHLVHELIASRLDALAEACAQLETASHSRFTRGAH